MLGHIYYAFGLIVLLISISMIMKFKKLNLIKEWRVKFKIVTGKDPQDKDFRDEEEKSLYNGMSMLSLIESIWVIIGLLTGSWFIFLSLLVYSTIINLINKPLKFTIVGKAISLKLLCIKALVYLFLILNHFHLHYDVLKLILR